MMKNIIWRDVGAIHQDFTSKTLKVLDKQTYPIWERRFESEESFNKTFSHLSKLFSQELLRRESEK